jgi:lipoate-protein ligase A
LIWSVSQAFDLDINEIYKAVCFKITAAFKDLGIYVSTGHTPGSFCDGKFNLSVNGQKIVGTAQSWKKINGTKVVLAHAVLLVDIEAETLIQAANAVEESIGSNRRYLANSITSIAQECCINGDIEMQTLSALAQQFTTQHLEISHGTS